MRLTQRLVLRTMVADRTLAAAVDEQILQDPRLAKMAMRKRSWQAEMETVMVAEVAAEIVDEALEVAATTTAGVEMVTTNGVVETTKEVVAEVVLAEVVVVLAEVMVVTTDVVVAMAVMTVAAEVAAVMVDVVAEAVIAVDKALLTMLGHTIHLVTIRA